MRVAVLALLLLVVATSCGPKTMAARLKDAERLADRATEALDEAEKAAAALEPKKMENALGDAKDFLGAKDSELYPEAQMNIDRYKELSAKLPQVQADREKKDLDARLNKARDRIVPRVQQMMDAQEALIATAPTKAKCEDLEERAKSLKDAVDDDLDLFVKDADFAAWAKSQRTKVDKANEAAARGRRGVAFLEGPVTAWKEGLAAQRDARTRKDAADKERLLTESRTKFTACSKDGKPFDADKTINTIAFTMPEGKPQTPALLIATCDKALKSGDAEFKKAIAAAKKKKKK